MKEKKGKILIVDDDNETRNMYSEAFLKAGFNVDGAKDGLEALDRISKDAPELVFTGIIMPRMSGFDLMEAMKKNVKSARIPVVVSSHLGREDDLKKARELGAVDFIVKGESTVNVVIERIERVLGKRFVYQLSVEKDKYDAHAFLQTLGASEEFTCTNCGGDMALNVEYFPKGKNFNIKAVCPVCGK